VRFGELDIPPSGGEGRVPHLLLEVPIRYSPKVVRRMSISETVESVKVASGRMVVIFPAWQVYAGRLLNSGQVPVQGPVGVVPRKHPELVWPPDSVQGAQEPHSGADLVPLVSLALVVSVA
jgi:hypothetical protein